MHAPIANACPGKLCGTKLDRHHAMRGGYHCTLLQAYNFIFAVVFAASSAQSFIRQSSSRVVAFWCRSLGFTAEKAITISLKSYISLHSTCSWMANCIVVTPKHIYISIYVIGRMECCSPNMSANKNVWKRHRVGLSMNWRKEGRKVMFSERLASFFLFFRHTYSFLFLSARDYLHSDI